MEGHKGHGTSPPSRRRPARGPTRGQAVVTALSYRFVTALGVLFLLAVVQFYVFGELAAEQDALAVELNLSGRQGVLTNEGALLAERMVATGADTEATRARLVEVIVELRATHQALRTGDATLGLSNATPDAVAALFEDPPTELDARVAEYLADLEALASAPNSDLDASNPHVAAVRDAAPAVAAGYDAVGRAFEADRADVLARLQLSALATLGSTVVVLVVMGAFVFRPTIARVRHEIQTLEDLRDTLEHRVAQRTADLEERTRQVERSNRELEQFAYVASHDLQEPLRMVASYLQLLEDDYGDQLDDDAREYMAFAVDGSRRMRTLVVDLLEFSRVGREDRPMDRVDVDRTLREALHNLEVAIDEADAKVDVGELPDVIGNRTELMQLFQNLVGNGLKFRGEASPRVSVTATREDDEWHFTVADNGIGIDPSHIDRIFRIFQRLQSRQDYEGTGIGLAMCKKIVERHGGRIWAESEGEGRGTAIHFTLPYVDFEEDRPPEDEPVQPIGYRRRGKELI